MALIIKELIQLKRDPISLRIAIAMPIGMMLLFGYAVNTEVDNIPTAVFDQSKTMQSRAYIEKFSVSQYFKIQNYVASERELSDLIDLGKVKAGIIIPSDYATKLKNNQQPQVQLIIDGTDPTTAQTAVSSGMMLSQAYNANIQNANLKKMGMKSFEMAGVSVNTKVWYNPNLEAKNFTIPGILAVILQNITIMLTAFALVREKERGTIEQLIVTPVKPVELIFAKIIPFIAIGYAAFLLSLAICVFWFKISIVGSLFLLLSLGFLFVICSLSIGMLISTVAQNQMQAMMGIIVFLLPSIILSGFVFPREAMPKIVFYIGYLAPTTYFIKIVRAIILKGVGVTYIYQDMISLFVFTGVLLLLATVRVRKSLD